LTIVLQAFTPHWRPAVTRFQMPQNSPETGQMGYFPTRLDT